MSTFRGVGNETILTEPLQPKKHVAQQNDDFPCPYCGATRFVRNEVWGKITNTGFDSMEESYLCRGCGQLIEQDKIDSYFGT